MSILRIMYQKSKDLACDCSYQKYFESIFFVINIKTLCIMPEDVLYIF